MTEPLKPSDIISTPPPQIEPADTATILKDIQQRLAFLERKIDTLINQTLERPTFQGRAFSRPPRPFNRFNKHRAGQHNNDSRDENFSSQSQPRHFDKPRVEGRQGFGAKKERFFHRGKGPHR